MERTLLFNFPCELARCPQLAALRRRRYFDERPLCARSCHSMNAHFANRRALTLFWRYYSGAVRTLSQGLRCPCQSRAEDQATATPVWLCSQSRLFPSVLTRATKDRARSQEIVGRRARSSNLVAGVRYNARPTIAEALFSYRRAPVTPA